MTCNNALPDSADFASGARPINMLHSYNINIVNARIADGGAPIAMTYIHDNMTTKHARIDFFIHNNRNTISNVYAIMLI